MLKIDYYLSFDIREHESGKRKASKEKIKYLKITTILKEYSLDAISSSKSFKVFKMIILEFYYLLSVIISREVKPELIIARSNLYFGTYLAANIFRIPLIYEIHSDILDESKILFSKSTTKKFLSWLLHYYSLFFLKRSSGIIFNNYILEKHYHKKYLPKNLYTISIANGSDTEYFKIVDKNKARTNLGLEKDATYLLFIGSVSKWHGVENVIYMFDYLKDIYCKKDLILLIVGGYNEEYLNELKKINLDNNHKVKFTGRVSLSDALYYINSADVCLLPVNDIRVSPGSPLKLYDYAACGKPIITQENTVGYSDVVEEYNLGICCDFTSHQKAAALISRFTMEFDEQYYEYNNRSAAEKYFSWNVKMEKWVEFGQEVINRSNK